MNNKQIMYDCDKGYVLSEKGPVGATCVGGLWRPFEMPECLPGLHPRLRWNRRKRDTNMHETPKLHKNFNDFKRQLREIIRSDSVIDDPFPLHQQMRAKRSLLHHKNVQRKIHRRPIRNYHTNSKWHLIAPAIMRFKRNINQKRYHQIEQQFARPLRNEYQQQQQRTRFEEEQQRAYDKYYEKIRAKHRNYINNLLKASTRQTINDDEPIIFDNKESTYQDEEDNYKIPVQDPFDEINAYASMPIPLPNINERRNVYVKKDMHNGVVNNTFVGRSRSEPMKPEYFSNVTNILNLLRSQIIQRRKRILYGGNSYEIVIPSNDNKKFHRVKRAPRAPKKNEDQFDEEVGSDTENPRRRKEPCEVKIVFFY